MITDKQLPQALDLEEMVIGAILLEGNAFSQVSSILNDDCFYKTSHQMVFRIARKLFSTHQPIDIGTVTNALRDTGEIELVGGPFGITQLTNRVASSANIEFHARIIFQQYIKRKIIEQFDKCVELAYSKIDPFELLNSAQLTLDGLYQALNKSGNQSWQSMVQDTYKQVSRSMDSDNHLFGLETGLAGIDVITSGRCPGDLVIIAARTSMGKTSRMLQEVFNIGFKNKQPVGIFSLEMPYKQLIIKMIANDFEVNSNIIRDGKVNENRRIDLARSFERLQQAPIYLNDISGISILELKSIARVWKKKYDIVALYVDYLQQVSGDRDYKGITEREVASVSKGLKALAKDLSIPVIALCQLNRESEKRGDHRPQLSDLRDSGAIEQDADVVELLFRPEYYNIFEEEGGKDLRGLMECNIAKNRNGATGKAVLKFNKEISRLTDVEKEEKMTTENLSYPFNN